MKKALTLLLAGVVGASAMVAPASASFIQEEAYYEVAFSVNKAATAWAPDGTYTPGEYFDIAVDESWRSSACADDANDQTAFGLDYKLALSWDENYFYTYIQYVDPNGHENLWGADPASMWYSGAVQLNFADEDQMGDQRLEYGIGLTSDTNELITNVWADYLGSGFAPKANEDYIVTVDGDTVTYEARTPFTAFTTMEAKEGTVVSCCYVLSWGNGQDYCHTQLAEGCTGNGKDAGAFAMVTLAGVGEVSAAAPAASASTAASALPAAYPCSGTAVPADSVLIAGELIGNELGWDGTEGSGRASAFDGDTATFFDPATASVDWCGIDAGEEMIITKIIIRPRDNWADRFDGATIEASNDPEFNDSVELYYNANGAAAEITFIDCTEDMDADANTGYRYFRYINYMKHGDVSEVELYGKAKDGSNPVYGAGAAAPAASASTTAAVSSEPTILWDFNSDEAMSDVMSSANAVSYFGDTVDGVECYEFLASGNDPYVSVNISADSVDDVVWAKARVKNPSYATAIELFGATNGRSLAGSECTHIDVKSEDEGWYTYLIYIPDENVKTVNAYKDPQYAITEPYWAGTVEYIRLDPLWREGDDGSDAGGNMSGGESIYIDYIAFFPTKEAALAFRTEDDNYAFPEQADGAAAAATTEAPAAAATETASTRKSAVAVGGAGIFTYDESDGEYWSPALTMLDKTGIIMALEDGSIVGYSDVSTYTDPANVKNMDTLESGWYEVVLCNLGTNAEWFPADVKGKVALCVRGDSTFTVKSQNSMDAGAVACLIGNNCRAVELVDETGVMTGEYENVSMSVDYYTIPMCALSSDVTARLVAQTADISIADAVVAVENVYFGDLELSVEHKKTAYIFLGTLEEYEANKTRTDATTITMGGTLAAPVVEEAPAVEETPVVEEAPVVEETPVVEEAPVVEEEVVETPAEEVVEEVEAPAAEEVVEEAPQTFDFGVIAAVAALVSAAGYALSKKR